MPRLFIAVPLPSAVAGSLACAVPEVRGLRPVAPELLHFTLAFIGAIPEERVPDVRAAVEDAASGLAPFTIAIDELGRFPADGPVRVVWAGAGEGRAALERAGGLVRAALRAREVAFDEKPLQPHVTLARVRGAAAPADRRELAEALGRARLPAGLRVEVDAIEVFESILSAAGPRYSSRARIPLGRAR